MALNGMCVLGGGCYISFSGGKDSVVMANEMAKVCKLLGYKLILVFVDTGLEFPEIRKFTKTFKSWLENEHQIEVELKTIRPKKRFLDILIEFGYPLISKEISKIVYGARHSVKKKQSYLNKLDGLNPDFTESKYKERYKPWKILLDMPFEMSNRCCYYIKEKPCIDYERETGYKPIIATMAEDSIQRKDAWLKSGCNAFKDGSNKKDKKREQSKPMSFWTEQDVLQYLKKYNIPYCEVYGDIKVEMTNYKRKQNKPTGKLKMTGCQNTGCIFCLFGSHCKDDKRLLLMKETHPKQYEYCLGGGEFNENGMWQPNKKGLGYKYIIDNWLPQIKY